MERLRTAAAMRKRSLFQDAVVSSESLAFRESKLNSVETARARKLEKKNAEEKETSQKKRECNAGESGCGDFFNFGLRMKKPFIRADDAGVEVCARFGQAALFPETQAVDEK